MSSYEITERDITMAIRTDPSSNHKAWMEGSQSIEGYFGTDGTFWSEPVPFDGMYNFAESMGSSEQQGGGMGLGGSIGTSESIADLDLGFTRGFSTPTPAKKEAHHPSSEPQTSPASPVTSVVKEHKNTAAVPSDRLTRAAKKVEEEKNKKRERRERRVPEPHSRLQPGRVVKNKK